MAHVELVLLGGPPQTGVPVVVSLLGFGGDGTTGSLRPRQVFQEAPAEDRYGPRVLPASQTSCCGPRPVRRFKSTPRPSRVEEGGLKAQLTGGHMHRGGRPLLKPAQGVGSKKKRRRRKRRPANRSVGTLFAGPRPLQT